MSSGGEFWGAWTDRPDGVMPLQRDLVAEHVLNGNCQFGGLLITLG